MHKTTWLSGSSCLDVFTSGSNTK